MKQERSTRHQRFELREEDHTVTSIVLTRDRPHKPSSGYALRNWQNIQSLALLGPVDVVSVGVEDAGELVDGVREWAQFSVRQRSRWDRIKTRCWLVRPGIYRSVDRYHSQIVAQWLSQRVAQRRYDVAVIEGISLASYLGDLKRARCRVVFDAHNAESVLCTAEVSARSAHGVPVLRRAKDWVVLRRMAQAERRAVLGSDVVWACSDEDARQIERAYGTPPRLTVVPNGVDVDAYRRAEAPGVGDDWSRLPITLIYPGLFSYSPNEEAAMRLITDVLPAVRARGYPARVVLVGRDPTPAMLAASRQDAEVQVTGAVESILSYLEQPCVVTLPITLGSGTRLKILEAFAVGRPVVSTAKGAEGIEAVDGEHLLIREDPEAMADAVIDLWSRPLLRKSLCGQALELVRSHYSWFVAAQRIAQSLGLSQVPTFKPWVAQAAPPEWDIARSS